jgi:hypothetical protein
MNAKEWDVVFNMECNPNFRRVNEFFPCGPSNNPQVFATRFFEFDEGEWVERAYYIPMMQ